MYGKARTGFSTFWPRTSRPQTPARVRSCGLSRYLDQAAGYGRGRLDVRRGCMKAQNAAVALLTGVALLVIAPFAGTPAAQQTPPPNPQGGGGRGNQFSFWSLGLKPIPLPTEPM